MAARRLPADRGGSIPTAPLCKHDWTVSRCSFDVAKELVGELHYSHGGSNTRVYCFGLWRRDQWLDTDCKGVTWWLPPTKLAALNVDPHWEGALSLTRLVCTADAPENACSFLIRHSMRQIDRDRWPWLVTYADEWQGHVGTIYKAAGWRESGRTKPLRT